MATGFSYDGDLPFWCTTQAVAAFARAAYLAGIERSSWSSLFQGSPSASAASVRGVLVMEVLTAAFLIPCILRKRRMLPLILLLSVPCVAVFDEGYLAKAVEPFLAAPQLMQNASMILGVLCAMSLFM